VVEADGAFAAHRRLVGLVDAHRWHLACEFSNWIEAASAA
jgi:hypothetical protein